MKTKKLLAPIPGATRLAVFLNPNPEYFMRSAITLAFILVAVGLLNVVSVRADDLADLAGKWTLKRKSSDGQAVTHQLTIKEGKFTFRLMSEGGSTVLYAEGTAKVVVAGAVRVLSLSDIKAGGSDTDLSPVDEKYEAPVRVAGSTLYLASGLDKEREESPRLDVYKKE